MAPVVTFYLACALIGNSAVALFFYWLDLPAMVFAPFAIASVAFSVGAFNLLFDKGMRDWQRWAIVITGLSAVVVTFACLHARFGLMSDGQMFHDIWTAGYFSIVTLTTLGYGDLKPSEAGRYFAALQALVGYLLLGVTVTVWAKFGQSRD